MAVIQAADVGSGYVDRAEIIRQINGLEAINTSTLSKYKTRDTSGTTTPRIYNATTFRGNLNGYKLRMKNSKKESVLRAKLANIGVSVDEVRIGAKAFGVWAGDDLLLDEYSFIFTKKQCAEMLGVSVNTITRYFKIISPKKENGLYIKRANKWDYAYTDDFWLVDDIIEQLIKLQ